MEERDHDVEMMAARVGARRFAEAIWGVIRYHAQEYHVSTAEIVGNLELIKHDFEHQNRETAEDDIDDTDDGEAWKTCRNPG